MEMQVPELSLPFASRVHPAADDIENATMQWTLDSGLIKGDAHERYLRTIRLGRWFPLAAPIGDPELVLLGSQLTAWCTMVDDHVVERSGDAATHLTAIVSRLLVFESVSRVPDAVEPDDALALALCDLMPRLRQAATPDQLARLYWYLTQYYLGVMAEASYTAQQVSTPLASYRRVRHLTTCIPPFFVMSEIARGLRTPLTVILGPDVMRVTALAVDLAGLINDIIGLPRDLARGDTRTLAHSLAADAQVNTAQAIDIMATRMRQTTAEFVREAQALGQPGYTSVLTDLLAGHLTWTKSTLRYTIGGWH